MGPGYLYGIRTEICMMKKLWILTVLLSVAMYSIAQSRLKVMVIFAHPARGGHNDNMNAGWIVREASALLNHR